MIGRINAVTGVSDALKEALLLLAASMDVVSEGLRETTPQETYTESFRELLDRMLEVDTAQKQFGKTLAGLNFDQFTAGVDLYEKQMAELQERVSLQEAL